MMMAMTFTMKLAVVMKMMTTMVIAITLLILMVILKSMMTTMMVPMIYGRGVSAHYSKRHRPHVR